MAAGTWNPTIEQGATWSRTVTYLDNGEPVDLTGYTARMDIVDGAGRTILQVDTTAGGLSIDGAAGTVTIDLTPVQTSKLHASPHKYNVELVADPDPRSETAAVQRLLEGTITVTRDWTKP